jgi:cytochrome c oxidase subunit II
VSETGASPIPHGAADHSERVERRWATVAVVILVLLVAVATFAAIHLGAMPQSRVETADPRTLHLFGEFIDSNLGSAVEPDGSVTVRAIGQQYSFTPSCILVPTDTPVTFRATSADVVHGFLVERTNINLMLVPGYISSLGARFETPGDRLMPCHEFCSVGHEGMWGRIRVIDKVAFARLASTQRRLSCVE